MESEKLSHGTGRTEVQLSIQQIGSDLIVCLSNEQGHIGAVAVADYDFKEDRASTSVITRLGHKDDLIACNAAYKLCKRFRKPVCAIAGIHLDNITQEEIDRITRNCDALIEQCIANISAY
jgi:gallate decarboxylase subunit D